MFNLDDAVRGASEPSPMVMQFVARPATLTSEARRAMSVPLSVASLTDGISGDASVMVQAAVDGAFGFLCNGAMASTYVSAAEAEDIYGASFADPDAVRFFFSFQCMYSRFLEFYIQVCGLLQILSSERDILDVASPRPSATAFACITCMDWSCALLCALSS
jgi:hypothetical protein